MQKHRVRRGVFSIMAKLPFKMQPDAVYMVPLGGCGFFGANMTLYGHQDKWIMIDCGMGFADDTMPGIDILLPDPEFAQSLGDKLLGIIFTHAHEDHIGAIEHLWPRLRAPLYATRFTMGRIRQDLDEMSWGHEVKLHEVPQQGTLDLGPFHLEFIRVCHSIPEANALAVSVKEIGTIVHTGDWKIDKDPVLGYQTDEAKMTQLGDRGVLAVVGDSTNAMVPGHSGSERNVLKNLAELFGEFKGLIAISCFSTNVARLVSIYEAARANNRHVVLVGRSLHSIDDVARESGYLKGIPPFLSDEDADMLDDGSLVYVCTGSQGEPRAALSRISQDEHPAVRLGEGDVVIFSSRAIPGNERAIDRIKNRFLAMGVNVVTDHDAQIHVSGHPYRDELKQLYGWLRPKVAIPVHGEQMQMEKHAELAKACGAEQAIIPKNGMVIELYKDGAQPLDVTVKAGVLAIEGKRIVAMDHEAILTRRRIMHNGSAVVTIVVDDRGTLVAPPKVTAMGLLDDSELDAEYLRGVTKEISEKIRNMPAAERADDALLSEAVRITARRFFSERFDRKPQTRVHLVRI